MSDEAAPRNASANRTAVVSAAIELFAAQGFESTSVEQIAQAAGVSRSTFFRQFGGKEDVVFADHDELLRELKTWLAAGHENPWSAVCDAALRVYAHFSRDPEMARRRYTVVRDVPALRDREIVAQYSYERLFDEYLREVLPAADPLETVAFAAEVTAIHNHVLRQLLRGTKRVPTQVLHDALDAVLRRFGVHPDGAPAAADDVVVAVFPRSMPAAEVSRRIRTTIGGA